MITAPIAPLPYNVIFAGCARNCEPYLPYIERNLQTISKIFSETNLIIFENDSNDQTQQLLQEFLKGASRRIILHADGMAHSSPHRTLRLAIARNAVMEVIRAKEFRSADYVILIDFDDVNAAPIDLGVIYKTIVSMANEPSWGASFANSTGVYYDLWALRHPNVCPGDLWLDSECYRIQHNVSVEKAFEVVFEPRIFQIPPSLPPFAVHSAFGGFGIYKAAPLRNSSASYVGDQSRLLKTDDGVKLFHYQACEHVAFHHSLRSETGVNLKIVPELVNRHVHSPGFRAASMIDLTIQTYAIN